MGDIPGRQTDAREKDQVVEVLERSKAAAIEKNDI